jgi:molybdate transport system ATP-binding protein
VKKSDRKGLASGEGGVLLELDAVSVRAGERLVLPEVHWTVRSGEQWAVVGPNGSGKTSLVRVAAGDLPAAGGRAFRAFGRNGRAAVGYVSFEVHRDLIARELWLDHARYASGAVSDFVVVRQLLGEAAKDEATLERSVELLGIQSILGRPFRHLSTGEIRKVLIARAFARDPEMLVLDEPFDGLDGPSRENLSCLLSDVIGQGIHLILVTHRLEEILPGVTHVLCLGGGRVVRSGTRTEVLGSPEVRSLFGASEGATASASVWTGSHGHAPWTASPPVGREGAAGGASPPVGDGGAAVAFSQPIAPPPGGATPPGRPMIEFRDVTVRYGEVVVLDRLNWTMRRGESWAIVGPNGAGKTTVLHLISADNLQGYANYIRLFGRRRGSGESIWEIKERMGVVTPHLQVTYLKRLSGRDVVASGFFDSVGLYRHPTVAQREIADWWIVHLGIEGLAERPFERLSYGERRLLLIARALVKSPEVLILDEPSQGLDPVNRRRVLDVVQWVGSHTETDLLFVTHHPGEVPACVDHVLELPGPGQAPSLDPAPDGSG